MFWSTSISPSFLSTYLWNMYIPEKRLTRDNSSPLSTFGGPGRTKAAANAGASTSAAFKRPRILDRKQCYEKRPLKIIIMKRKSKRNESHASGVCCLDWGSKGRTKSKGKDKKEAWNQKDGKERECHSLVSDEAAQSFDGVGVYTNRNQQLLTTHALTLKVRRK